MRRKLGILLALILFAHVSPAAFAQQEQRVELVAGNTSFALDLYAELRQGADGNLLFSPYSVSQALAMTYAGAGGETAAQMAEALGFTLPQPDLHQAFAALNADLVARGTAEGGTPTSGIVSAPEGIIIAIEELNGSGVSGDAILTDNGDESTTIDVLVDGATSDHPIHLYTGTCGELGDIVVPLHALDASGASMTDVPIALSTLIEQGSHAINIHRSEDDIEGSIACGGIVAPEASGASPIGSEQTHPPRALHIANGLWGEQSFPFSQAYLEQVAMFYSAGLQLTDFINAPEAAREDINVWIAEQAAGHIEDIVPEGVISPDTPLVLANAIYFYGSWAHPLHNTSQEPFYRLDGTTVTVPLMEITEYLDYARGDDFQAIEFPYADSKFAFTVILPDEGQFAVVEQQLDAAMLSSAFSQPDSTRLNVFLPKFEFEYGASLEATLQSLGVRDAFDPKTADFSEMIDEAVPVPIYLARVLHEAFISVDEEGTEAAAATVVIPTVGGMGPTDEPLEVRIDRPFLFAIRDTETGSVLFLGRVMNPSPSA